MLERYGEVVETVTMDYLKNYKGGTPDKSGANQIAFDLIDSMRMYVDTHNAAYPNNKWKAEEELSCSQIGMILVHLHHVVNIDFAMSGRDAVTVVAMYQETGDDKGIYSTADKDINKLIRWYNFGATEKEIREIKAFIRDFAEVKTPNTNFDLIPCANGIFNYRTKELTDYTPDIVFLAKSPVNFNPLAQNVVIHNDQDGTDWDVESWMSNFYDDKDTVELLWQIIGACLRPLVRWDKSAWFYSESGNNGKGTLVELMRQLCGEHSCASISLAEMGQDFRLEPLMRASVILTDENDVGTYIDKAANLKAIITHDVLQVNRKFKEVIPLRPQVFMVQCLNEFPKIRDTSDSLYRRQIFVPFLKCFTGAERKYIKSDYLKRKEVLEYVMYRVLMKMDDYYELATTALCDNALDEYKECNDPVRQFVHDVLPQCKWDMLPFKFVYELYVAWYRKSIGDHMYISNIKFNTRLIAIINAENDWVCRDRNKTYSVHTAMAATPEPLIAEYHLEEWMNPYYKSSQDVNKKCVFQGWVSRYKGIVRVGSAYDK